MLTYAALEKWPELQKIPLIQPESLESFVWAEKDALQKILQDYEIWAQKNISAYAPLPQELVFKSTSKSAQELTQKFILSLRVNPELSFANFVLYAPGMPHRIKNEFSAAEKLLNPVASLLKLQAFEPVLEKVGLEPLSALEIIATASEEPDHGLDLGLWEDNQSSYGKKMGLGPQPFGSPSVSFSSQAPFHMGFYYENPALYWAAGWLKRAYPEYRISLFIRLAEHAFASGHPYWGYRFLGWALHYIQDLTQPYHATLAPGLSWIKLVALNALEIIGIKNPAQNLRQLLTNKHMALESYQFELTINRASNEFLARALADTQKDKNYPAWNLSYARNIVAKEAHERANITDKLLIKAMPKLYVDDATYNFSNIEPNINLRVLAFKKDPKNAQELELEFLNLMKSYGAHTRNTLKHFLPKP